MIKCNFSKRILIAESIGLLTVIFFLWIDEIFDLPHNFFGYRQTPINLGECIFETLIIVCVSVLIILITIHLLKRIKNLEGLLLICHFCKKIKIDEDWSEIENYISENSEAEVSHGVCPDCIEKHYGKSLGPVRLKKILIKIANKKDGIDPCSLLPEKNPHKDL